MPAFEQGSEVLANATKRLQRYTWWRAERLSPKLGALLCPPMGVLGGSGVCGCDRSCRAVRAACAAGGLLRRLHKQSLSLVHV